MSDKKACLECLAGLRKNNQNELIDQLAYRKSHSYFTYADLICNGCCKFLVSDRGDFPGAPIESMKHMMFFYNHFKWLFAKIEKSISKEDEERKEILKMSKKNLNKYITMALIKTHNKFEIYGDLQAIVYDIDSKIYEGILSKQFVMEQNMIIGDVRTGQAYKKRK